MKQTNTSQYIHQVVEWRRKTKEEGQWGSVNICGMYPYEVIDNLLDKLTLSNLELRTLKAELAHIKAGDSKLQFP